MGNKDVVWNPAVLPILRRVYLVDRYIVAMFMMNPTLCFSFNDFKTAVEFIDTNYPTVAGWVDDMAISYNIGMEEWLDAPRDGNPETTPTCFPPLIGMLFRLVEVDDAFQ